MSLQMNISKKFYIFLFFVMRIITLKNNNVSADLIQVSSRPCSRCPNITVPLDINNPGGLKEYYRYFTKSIWSLVGLTPLLTELRDIILEMSTADSYLLSHFAGMYSSIMIPAIGAPSSYHSLCLHAKVVNGSLNYIKTKDAEDYMHAITSLMQIYRTNCHVLSHAALDAMGCRQIEVPVTARDCYEHGLVFCADEVWNFFGELMPCKLNEVFLKLYNSSIFEERVHATLIAFTLTPVQASLFDMHDQRATAESLLSYVEAKNTPKFCCKRRKTNLDDLCDYHRTTAEAEVKILTDNFFGNKCHDE